MKCAYSAQKCYLSNHVICTVNYNTDLAGHHYNGRKTLILIVTGLLTKNDNLFLILQFLQLLIQYIYIYVRSYVRCF